MPLDCSFGCLRLSKAKSGVGFGVLIKKNSETEAYWVASISFLVEGRLNCAKRKKLPSTGIFYCIVPPLPCFFNIKFNVLCYCVFFQKITS